MAYVQLQEAHQKQPTVIWGKKQNLRHGYQDEDIKNCHLQRHNHAYTPLSLASGRSRAEILQQ
uniref:Uncharacterized protein n=1 Tax=Apteryx owenii TaxID=8824 RepID=A0A8B9QE44_APTOW